MEPAWVLIGMMGAGKSSVGRVLADLSARQFVDTDGVLVQRFGRPIPQIFQVYGEAAFRDHESNVLRSLERGPTVISTGGGIVCRPENWVELRRLGTIIYLRAKIEVLVERLEVSKKKRPLLQTEDWQATLKNLLDERTPLYESADLIIEVGAGDLEAEARELHRKLTTSTPQPPYSPQ